jgi:hypothetical protein
MKILKLLFLFAGLGLKASYGQESAEISVSLPEVALLDLEPRASEVVLEIKAPINAGSIINGAESQNAKFLNYSSAVGREKYRDVFIQIEYGMVPPGLRLSVQASECFGGMGTLGRPLGKVVLSANPQRIINSIGGAFTGNGAKNGHALSYFLDIVNVAELDFNASNKIGIVFTFIDF